MHENFLDAIRAEPDDLTHRLVYADWLEEHGTTPLDAARAELIRVQIARENADPAGDHYWALRARERVLLARWEVDLAGKLHRQVRRYRFRRGFVEWIDVSAGGWINLLGRCRPPIVKALQLHGNCQHLRMNHLAGITHLDLRHADLGLAGTMSLAAILDLSDIRVLDLPPVVTPRLRDLLKFGFAQRLEHLGLPADGVHSERCLRDLVAAPQLPALRSLRLAVTTVTGRQALQSFFASPRLAALRSLTFQGQSFGPAVLGLLSRSAGATGLRRLRIERSGSSILELPPGNFLSGLESLEIAGVATLGGPVGEFLCSLTNLRELRLQEVGAVECKEALRGLASWPALHTFEMGEVAKLGCWPIVRGGVVPALRRLRVDGAEPGLLPCCFHLAELSSPRTHGYAVWSDYPAITAHPSLTTLDLPGRVIGPRLLRALLDRSAFPRLAWVDLRGARLPQEALELLGERLGVGAQLGATQAASRAYDAEQALAAESPL
jgi:uncharacterized protein (TIGR02996 family)